VRHFYDLSSFPLVAEVAHTRDQAWFDGDIKSYLS